MEARVNITLDITDIWADLIHSERDEFIKEIISVIDSDLIIDELELRGYTVKKDE